MDIGDNCYVECANISRRYVLGCMRTRAHVLCLIWLYKFTRNASVHSRRPELNDQKIEALYSLCGR
jgi:hypothetical protein